MTLGDDHLVIIIVVRRDFAIFKNHLTCMNNNLLVFEPYTGDLNGAAVLVKP